MDVIAFANQPNEGCQQFLTVADQVGGLLDDSTLGCDQAGHALVEDDLENSRRVANFFPGSLEV